jgi:VIT1/CCC1 family predicted Fe2+/Mn2+ transporter
MRWANKFAGYFFGALLVLFGFFWIESTMTIPVIFIGSIGLIIVLGGFAIIYLGHRSGRQKKLLH